MPLFLLRLDRGDAGWVEDPGYPGAAAAARLAGARPAPVPVDAGGACIGAGRAQPAGARGLRHARPPVHQYPTEAGGLGEAERRAVAARLCVEARRACAR